MSKIQKTDESAGLIEFFKKLIPSEALSNETTTMISADFLRLRYETAQSLKTCNPMLAGDELARFQENCRIAAAVSLGIELRNYLLFEIYSTEQYRQTDQDFVAFGRRMTELSKAQLMRCVHAGRIRVSMILADLDDVRPTGRQVEALSKIEEEHTVRAWLHTLDVMRIHGRSDDTAREGLMEYCKIEQIPYGKRMPNGSRKTAVQKALRRRKNVNKKDPVSPEMPSAKGIWKLTPHEQQLILWIDPDADLPLSDDELQNRLTRHVEAIEKLADTNRVSEFETRQLEELLALLVRKDEAVARSLVKLALQALRVLMLEEIKKSEFAGDDNA